MRICKQDPDVTKFVLLQRKHVTYGSDFQGSRYVDLHRRMVEIDPSACRSAERSQCDPGIFDDVCVVLLHEQMYANTCVVGLILVSDCTCKDVSLLHPRRNHVTRCRALLS